MTFDPLKQMRERNNPVSQKLREMEVNIQQALRSANGQQDINVLQPRLYYDGLASSALKILTIVPRESGQVSLWGDNGWQSFPLPPSVTLDFAAGTSGKKHAVYMYIDAMSTGTIIDQPVIALEYEAWTNETTRATALVNTDGVLLKSGDPTRRWIQDVYYDGTLVSCTGGIDPNNGQYYGTGDPTNADANTTGAGVVDPGILFGSYRMNFFTLLAGVLQVGFNTLGQLLAGAGAVIIDASGIALKGNNYNTAASINYVNTSGDVIGHIYGFDSAISDASDLTVLSTSNRNSNSLGLLCSGNGSGISSASVTGYASGAGDGYASVVAQNGTGSGTASQATIEASITGAGAKRIRITAPLTIVESVAPATAATPAANYSSIYPKTDHYWYIKDSAALEYRLATTALIGTAFNEAQGANIASATTTDIGAATGNYVQVTGTTTITALGTVQAGARRIVNFTGALTITYNATSLILPGAANIVTVAGDTAVFVSLGSGNWICTSYSRNASAPATGSNTGDVTLGTQKSGLSLFNQVVSLAPDGWTEANETWTRVSASTMTSPTDTTARYKKGTMLKWTDNSTVHYGALAIDSTFAAGVTTLTIIVNTDHVIGTGGISANFYSYNVNALGWPVLFNFTSVPSASGGGALTTTTLNSARYYTVGDIMTVWIDLTLTNKGTGAGTMQLSIPVTVSGVAYLNGRETVRTGFSLTGQLSGTNVILRDYASLAQLTNTDRYTINGSFAF